jgi:hypothetical protein
MISRNPMPGPLALYLSLVIAAVGCSPQRSEAAEPTTRPPMACLEPGDQVVTARTGSECGERGVPVGVQSSRVRLLGLVDLGGDATWFNYRSRSSRLPQELPADSRKPAAMYLAESGTPGAVGSRWELFLVGEEDGQAVLLGDVLLSLTGEGMDLEALERIHLERAPDREFLDVVSYRTAVPVEGPGRPGPPQQHRLRLVDGRYEVVEGE